MATPSDLANTNIYSFLCVFTVYFILLFYFIISGNDYSMANIYMYIIIFIFITFVVQLGCNAYLTSRKEICGKTDMGVALSSTTYPWVFVYSILMILVVMIPGWLRLFSNTFGIYAANAYGLKELLSKSFFNIANKNTKNIDSTLVNVINSIYNDPILLINELDPSNFNLKKDENNQPTDFSWESYDKMVSTGLFNFSKTVIKEISKEGPAASGTPASGATGSSAASGASGTPAATSTSGSPAAALTAAAKSVSSIGNTMPSIDDVIELHKIILLKDTVGISFWLFLGGIISVLISTNTLLNTRCKQLGREQYNNIFNN